MGDVVITRARRYWREMGAKERRSGFGRNAERGHVGRKPEAILASRLEGMNAPVLLRATNRTLYYFTYVNDEDPLTDASTKRVTHVTIYKAYSK